MEPETRYAVSGDVRVAYQVVGDGGHDLVLVPGLVSNIELCWEHPGYERFIRRLAEFARVIVFDKRGSGLSDPIDEAGTIEERMDDVRAVMDAAGSERAHVFGWSEGAAIGTVFAATHPERASALVLYGSFARGTPADDHPWGLVPDAWELMLQEEHEESWGRGPRRGAGLGDGEGPGRGLRARVQRSRNALAEGDSRRVAAVRGRRRRRPRLASVRLVGGVGRGAGLLGQ